MYRKNLVINFGKIQELATGAIAYKQDLSELKNSVNSFRNVVEDNSGAAATEMNKSAPENITYIDGLMEGLDKVDRVLKSYDSEMKSIIAPLNDGADMRIATEEIKTSMKELYNELESLKSTIKITNIPTVKLDDNESGTDNSSQASLEIVKEIERTKAKQEAMAQIINSVCEKYLPDIDKIVDKVDKFAQKDSDFESQIDGIYKEITDLQWYETEDFKIFFTVCVAADAVISLATPYAPIGASVLLNLSIAGGFSIASSVYGQEDIEASLYNDLNEEAVTQVLTVGMGNSKVIHGYEAVTDYISNPKVKRFLANNKDEIFEGIKEYTKSKALGEDKSVSETITDGIIDKKIDKVGDKAIDKIDDLDLGNLNRGKKGLKQGSNMLKEDAKEYSKGYVNQVGDQMEEGEVDPSKIKKPEDKYFREDKIEGAKNAFDDIFDDDKKEKFINRMLNLGH